MIYEREDFNRLVYAAVKKHNYVGLIKKCGYSIEDFVGEVKSHCWLYKPDESHQPSTIIYHQVRWVLGKMMAKNKNVQRLERDIGYTEEYPHAKETIEKLMKCNSLTEKERNYLNLRLSDKSSSDIMKSMSITRQRLEQLKRTSFRKIKDYAEKVLD